MPKPLTSSMPLFWMRLVTMSKALLRFSRSSGFRSERLQVVEVGLSRNRAHAQAADVFDAALLDEVGDDVEGLVEVLQVVRLEVGNGAEYSAPGADLDRKS